MVRAVRRARSDLEATAPLTATKSQGNRIHPDGRWPIWTISCTATRPGSLAQRDPHLSESPFGDHSPAVRRSQSIRRGSRSLASHLSSGTPAAQRLRASPKTAEGTPSVLASSDLRVRRHSPLYVRVRTSRFDQFRGVGEAAACGGRLRSSRVPALRRNARQNLDDHLASDPS